MSKLSPHVLVVPGVCSIVSRDTGTYTICVCIVKNASMERKHEGSGSTSTEAIRYK